MTQENEFHRLAYRLDDVRAYHDNHQDACTQPHNHYRDDLADAAKALHDASDYDEKCRLLDYCRRMLGEEKEYWLGELQGDNRDEAETHLDRINSMLDDIGGPS